MQHFSSCDSWPRHPLVRWYGLALLLALLWLGSPQASQAQAPKAGAAPSFFQADAAALARATTGAVGSVGRALLLDTAALRATLRQVPTAGTTGSRGGAAGGLLIALPLPDGSTGQFEIYESSVMAPALAAQFPQIKTYAGRGVDDPTATICLDMTPRGFHAQVLSATAGTSYIDPVGNPNTLRYHSFFKKDLQYDESNSFRCSQQASAQPATAPVPVKTPASGPGIPFQRYSSDGNLRTYHLALACTPAYARFMGNTDALVLSAMTTAIARITSIYQLELGIRLELIANNNLLIFNNVRNPQYPYSLIKDIDNLAANQVNVDSIILSQNYDIGHVFTRGTNNLASGRAYRGAVGYNGRKALEAV